MTRPFLFLLLLLLIPFTAQAGGNTGIGYVDMQRVLEESKLGKRLQEQLRKEFEPRGKELAQEELQIQQMQEALERDKLLMSKDQATKKEKDIQARIEAFQKKALPIQQALMKAQQEKGREIIEPAREAVNRVAAKKKLGMVVERGLAGLVYIDDALEITNDVIKQLDAKHK